MSTPPATQRPGTVTAVCIILFISAGLGILGGCGLLVAGGTDEVTQATGITGGTVVGLGVVTMIIAVVQLVLAIMLWRGSNGARIALIVLQVIDIVLAAVSFDLSSILGIAISVIIVVLLLNAATKRYTGAA